jgi:hypothetical protein
MLATNAFIVVVIMMAVDVGVRISLFSEHVRFTGTVAMHQMYVETMV